MRVSDQSFYLKFLAGLALSRESTAAGLESLADGKKVRVASDDPTGSQASLRLRARLARIAGLDRSAQSARTDLITIDTTLSAVTNILTQARTEAIAGASGAQGEPDPIRAAKIERLRDSLLALANTEQGGRSLFGGTETLSPPFASDGTYSGNDDEVLAPVEAQEQVGATLSGRRVFQDGGDVLTILDDLSQALRDGRKDDAAALAPDLKAALDHVGQVHADVGFRLQRIESVVDAHGDETLNLVRRIGEIEDADVAELIVNLQAADNASAALSAAAARFLGRSLFDYLG